MRGLVKKPKVFRIAKRFEIHSMKGAAGLFFGIFVAFFALLLTYPYKVSNVSAVGESTVSSISISPVDQLKINVIPGRYSSGTVPINISTTNRSGYTIMLETIGDSSSLVNIDDTDNIIPTLSSNNGILASEIAGKYGISINGTNFYPAPEPNGSTFALKTTTTSGTNRHDLTFGVNASADTVGGIYNNEYIISVLANPTGNSLEFDENTTDEVGNMPNPQIANIGERILTISNAVPVREGYEFVGWDVDSTATEPQYTPSDVFTFDTTQSQNTVLYAIWGEIIDEGEIKFSANFGQKLSFDGKSSLNTNIPLFSNEFIDTYFEVSCGIERFIYNTDQENNINSLVSDMDESDPPYSGFVFRNNRNSSNYELSRNTGTQQSPANSSPTFSVANTKTLKLTRDENHDFYYETNMSPKTMTINYANIVPFNTPLVFGSSLNTYGNATRFFKGEMTDAKLTRKYEKTSDETLYVTLPSPMMTSKEFDGWYSNKALTKKIGDAGDSIAISRDTTVYAKWKNVGETMQEYNHPGQIVFDGTNYINTGMYLFSPENFDRDFVMTLHIDSVGTNDNMDAIVGSLDERGRPYSGFVLRKHTYQGNDVIQLHSNGSGAASTKYFDTVGDIVIIRSNNKVYYKIDDSPLHLLNTYDPEVDWFNSPVTLGAALDTNGGPFRYFEGAISNVSIRYVDEGVSLADYEYPTKATKLAYEYSGEMVFDGAHYIDTGIKLFNDAATTAKDFTIMLNVVEVDPSNANQSVILNAKDESGRPWPGLVFRTTGSDLEITFNKNASTNAKRKLTKKPDTVRIMRKSGHIFVSLSEFGDEEELIDSSGFSMYFDTTLTFGAALDGTNTPFRYFKGKLSNIKVYIEE